MTFPIFPQRILNEAWLAFTGGKHRAHVAYMLPDLTRVEPGTSCWNAT